MEISKMIALSTAHLKKETITALRRNEINSIHYYETKDFRFFVEVREDDFPTVYHTNCPLDLSSCMVHARENDCKWIMFDCDVEPNPELRIFEWISPAYICAMTVGACVSNPYEDVELPDEWSGTEECGDFAYAVYCLMQEKKISHLSILGVDSCARRVFAQLMNGTFMSRRPKFGDYDDFAKGFLAGQILGEPNYENLEIALNAEKQWRHGKSGYYQDILNELKDSL